MPDTAANQPPPLISPDEAVAIVQQSRPDLQPSQVFMPASAYSHYFIRGRNQYYPLIFETFQVNPYNGDIEKQRLLSDNSTLELVTESMRPLHTGDFVGLTLKLIYFFFGILLTMMVFSGMMIWSKRTFRATAAAVREKQILKERVTAQAGAQTSNPAVARGDA